MFLDFGALMQTLSYKSRCPECGVCCGSGGKASIEEFTSAELTISTTVIAHQRRSCLQWHSFPQTPESTLDSDIQTRIRTSSAHKGDGVLTLCSLQALCGSFYGEACWHLASPSGQLNRSTIEACPPSRTSKAEMTMSTHGPRRTVAGHPPYFNATRPLSPSLSPPVNLSRAHSSPISWSSSANPLQGLALAPLTSIILYP